MPREISIVKNDEQHIVRYEEGEESAVLDSLVAMVKDEHSSMDWFDAAVLSHQLGRLLARDCKPTRPLK